MVMYITYDALIKWMLKEVEEDKLVPISDEFKRGIDFYLGSFNWRKEKMDKTSRFYSDEIERLDKNYKRAISMLEYIKVIRDHKEKKNDRPRPIQ